ncbi:MAG: DNA adenine methylase [Fibrobacter sp.]|nr:DNA adenine methylase [Fibrobacter sp.]
MKPLLKYRGGKSKEIPHIIKHIPEYKGKYIEPFFGGGAVFFHLEPEKAIINDINAKLMGFYKGIQSDFETIREELSQIEKKYKDNRRNFEMLKAQNPRKRVKDDNEPFYYKMRDMFNNNAKKTYSDATLYFYINKTAYSGMVRYNSKGEFNVPYGRYKNFNTSLITNSHYRLLKNTEIYNLDYKAIFEKANEEDFMFLDPPYDCVFSDYGNSEYKNGFTEEDQRELAENYRNLKCKALMVIGRTPLIEELYGDLIVDEYPKTYAVNIRNRFKSSANHVLVSNYGVISPKKCPAINFGQIELSLTY